MRHDPDWKAEWIYGDKNSDGRVERIKLMSDNMVMYIDTFDGVPSKNGTPTSKKCEDCQEVLARKSATSNQLPALEVQRIRYSLEGGMANASILRQKDGTYVLSRSNNSSYLSTFRAMSIFESNDAYKSESAEEFAKNPDLEQASHIFSTLYYEQYE